MNLSVGTLSECKTLFDEYTWVGMTVGDDARVGAGVTVVVCPAATEPQEAGAMMSITVQSIIIILLFCVLL